MGQEVCIRDYELSKSIEMLFHFPIYIYGAGHEGQNLEYLLNHVGLEVRCFIDKRAGGEIQRNLEVITVDTFAERRIKKERCIIVLAIMSNPNILLEELRKRKIYAKYIFSGGAVEAAILSNLDDCRFPKELGNDYVSIKRDRAKPSLNQILDRNLWIWQAAKVGSSTILHTLRHYGVDCVSFHNIVRLSKEESIDGNLLIKKVKTEPIKVITLVREPIARDFSQYFQGYALHCVDKKSIQDVLLEFAEEDYQFKWFDGEIKALLGIDIFEYPFDREKGFGLIKKDNIEILILKLESLNQNTDILGEFVGVENLELKNANESDKKSYAKLYKEAKDTIVIPQKIIDRYYKGNERMDYFYTETEKKGFLEKWRIY